MRFQGSKKNNSNRVQRSDWIWLDLAGSACRAAEKGGYDQWEKQGRKTMEKRAAEKVDRILENLKVEPLPEDIKAAIKDIVAKEQAWIDSRNSYHSA